MTPNRCRLKICEINKEKERMNTLTEKWRNQRDKEEIKVEINKKYSISSKVQNAIAFPFPNRYNVQLSII